jgi:hypothetical protein
MFDFATASTSDTRRDALELLLDRLYLRALEGDLRPYDGSRKGLAELLVANEPWMRVQLATTAHLGSLKSLSLSASRWDYAHLCTGLLLEIKEEFPGLGLGTVSLNDKHRCTGLELAQSWVLLTNIGHLFGTFATERALLFELKRAPALEKVFLESVPESLQAHVASTLATADIHAFFYALAARRICAIQTPDLRLKAEAALLKFFERRAAGGTDAISWAFRAARQLAYNRMHLYLRAGTSLDTVHSSRSIGDLLPYKHIGFDREIHSADSSLKKLLDGLDVHHAETFFTSEPAAALVLAHLRDFREWWAHRRVSSANVLETIDSLHGAGPGDWKDAAQQKLHHLVRLRVPGTVSWHEEVARWRAASAWVHADFLVSPLSNSTSMVCDVYTRHPVPDPATLASVAQRLASHSQQSWLRSAPDETDRRLWRTAGVFGCRVLELAMRPRVQPLLLPESLHSGHAGYAILASGNSHEALSRADTMLQCFADPTRPRQREFKATIEFLRPILARETAPWLLFAGEVRLVDGGERATPLGELDGAACIFRQDAVTWFFLEHKQSSGGGQGQLHNRLSQCFVPESEQEPAASSSGKLSARRMRWAGERRVA